MEEAHKHFHWYREIFKTSGVRPNGFSLPWQHSLDHYIQHIQNFSAPNGLCSSITKAKHIKAIKEPWRRSNCYEALEQMLLTNQRLEKLAYTHADFSAHGMLSGTCLSKAVATLALAQPLPTPAPPAVLLDEALFDDNPFTDPLDDDNDDADANNNANNTHSTESDHRCDLSHED